MVLAIKRRRKRKGLNLPDSFVPGFLQRLDGRTQTARDLQRRYSQILKDIGDDASHVKSALVERFVWLEAMLQTIEHELATGELNREEALPKWTQNLNTLLGLAKHLGVDRKSSSRPWESPKLQHVGAGR